MPTAALVAHVTIAMEGGFVMNSREEIDTAVAEDSLVIFEDLVDDS